MNIKKVDVSVYSSAGNCRANNEDNFFINGIYNNDSFDLLKQKFFIKTPCLAAVYDGLAGLESGEDASRLAAKITNVLYEKVLNNTINENSIYSFYKDANKILCKYQDDNNVDFGTTVAMVLIKNECISFSNLGDSRIYLLSNNYLSQMSIDHNEKSLSGKSGAFGNCLSQYLGSKETEFTIEPYIITINELDSKDNCILVCSDGVSNSLSELDLKNLMSNSKNNIAESVVNAALSNGSRDNVTAISIKF